MNNPIEDLNISCRTTCGCGNPLVRYEGQIDDDNYLLTCRPYSNDYNHLLLIAIDKNSPVFVKARTLDKLQQHCNDEVDIIKLCNNLDEIKKDFKQNQKLRELINNIDIEKLIEAVHTADMKTPVGKDGRKFFVDTHYKLKDIQKLLEASKSG